MSLLKKMKGEPTEAKLRFQKEAGILNRVMCHRNLSEYLRFCKKPLALVSEIGGICKKISFQKNCKLLNPVW